MGKKSDYERRQIERNNNAVFRRHALRRWKSCQWCGESFTKANPATTNHVVPRSKGGSDNWNNLVLSCHTCNHDRGNRKATREPLGPRWTKPDRYKQKPAA